MTWKLWLARNLVALGVSLLITMISAVLAAIFRAGGDAAAATAIGGVVYVAGATAILCALGQLTLLTLVELSRPEPGPTPPPSTSL